MQRFVRVGRATIHFLEGVAHDPRDGERVAAALDALRPARVHVDLTPLESRLLAEDPDSLEPFAARLHELVAALGPARPNALYHAVAEWSVRAGTPVELLLPDQPPAPPGRRWPRPTGLRLLDRILRQEGFDAADARSAVLRFHRHYVARVPELSAWVAARRRASAQALVRAWAGRQGEGAAVFAHPDADAVADEAHRLTAPRPS